MSRTATEDMPAGVTLTSAAHDELVREMLQHRAAAAAATVRAETARNALLVGWVGWIDRQSARTSPTAAAAADRAGEARARAIAAIDAYDPARGVPLQNWLRTSHAVHGEAVAQAGMPLTSGTPQQRRENAGQGVSPQRLVSTSAGVENGVANLADALPSLDDGPEQVVEAAERARALSAAVAATGQKTADILRRFYGLGGQQEHTAAEIAKDLGTTVAAVEMRLSRGRAAIRRRTDITDLRH